MAMLQLLPSMRSEHTCYLQRALSEAYGIVINVITSDQQNWFMRYEPEVQPKNNIEVFVTYIAPIHYNAVRYEAHQKTMQICFAMLCASSIAYEHKTNCNIVHSISTCLALMQYMMVQIVCCVHKA